MERLLDIEVTEYGTIIEEVELVCTMTGFGRRFLIHHLGEGFFRSVELFPVDPARFFAEYPAARTGMVGFEQPEERAA